MPHPTTHEAEAVALATVVHHGQHHKVAVHGTEERVVLLIWAIRARKFSILYVALGILPELAAAMAMYRLVERSVDELPNLALHRRTDLRRTPRPGAHCVCGSLHSTIPSSRNWTTSSITTHTSALPKCFGSSPAHAIAASCPARTTCLPVPPPLLGTDANSLQATMEEGKHWRTIHLRTDSSALIVQDIADQELS